MISYGTSKEYMIMAAVVSNAPVPRACIVHGKLLSTTRCLVSVSVPGLTSWPMRLTCWLILLRS